MRTREEIEADENLTDAEREAELAGLDTAAAGEGKGEGEGESEGEGEGEGEAEGGEGKGAEGEGEGEGKGKGDESAASRLAKERDEARARVEEVQRELDETRRAPPPAEAVKETAEQRRARYEADPYKFHEDEVAERQATRDYNAAKAESLRVLRMIFSDDRARKDPNFKDRAKAILTRYNFNGVPENDAELFWLKYEKDYPASKVKSPTKIGKDAMAAARKGAGSPAGGKKTDAELDRLMVDKGEGAVKDWKGELGHYGIDPEA